MSDLTIRECAMIVASLVVFIGAWCAVAPYFRRVAANRRWVKSMRRRKPEAHTIVRNERYW